MAAPPQVFVEDPVQVSVLSGDNLTLSCKYKGIPRPSITWLHNNSAMNLTDPGVSVATLDVNSTLTVLDISTAKGGTYRCLAENSLGNDDIVFSATVLSESFLRAAIRSVKGVVD
jgi:hypothetical protein